MTLFPPVAFIGASLLLTVASPVWAHAKPEQMSPQANQVVAAPKEVQIDFSEALEPSFSSIEVLNAKGTQVNTASAKVDAKAEKTLRVALPVLPTGKYQVKWNAVARDGHRTHGDYSFSVQ